MKPLKCSAIPEAVFPALIYIKCANADFETVHSSSIFTFDGYTSSLYHLKIQSQNQIGPILLIELYPSTTTVTNSIIGQFLKP